MSASKNKKNISIPIGEGLRNSLESLQASLDDWVAVEKNLTNPTPQNPEAKLTPNSDKDLLTKLVAQIEKLSN